MTTLKKGLWDSDEEDNAAALKSKEALKLSRPAGGGHKPSLFDSDDGEDMFPTKTSRTNKVLGLFDDDDVVLLGGKSDYEKLYFEEVAKRQELELKAIKLQEEIIALKLKLLAVDGDYDDQQSEGFGNAKDAEWEILAKEEKARRQRAVQQKASRHRASRRVVNTPSADAQDYVTVLNPNSTSCSATATATGAGAGAAVTGAAVTGAAAVAAVAGSRAMQVGHYLDSDEEEQAREAAASSTVSAAANTANTANDGAYGDSVLSTANSTDDLSVHSISVSPVNPPSSLEGSDGPVPIVEDAEAAKWRELAAQEKARKALARRSVRVVRRPAVSVNNVNAAAQIKNSGSLQNLQAPPPSITLAESSEPPVAISGASRDVGVVSGGANKNAARKGTSVRFDSSDADSSGSDWDSHSEEEKEEEEEVAEVVGTSPNVPTPKAAPVVVGVSSSSGSGGTGSSGGTGPAADLSAAEEATMDRRLRAWAAGRTTTQLLCSVPAAAQLSAAPLLSSGEVAAAAQALADTPALSEAADTNYGANNKSGTINGQQSQGSASDVRKAYMRIIRHCHPDKHMHLNPRGGAFLELQKIFTILSDSYNRFKATQQG